MKTQVSNEITSFFEEWNSGKKNYAVYWKSSMSTDPGVVVPAIFVDLSVTAEFKGIVWSGQELGWGIYLSNEVISSSDVVTISVFPLKEAVLSRKLISTPIEPILEY